MILPITHIVYPVLINSPVAISYGDGRNKNAKANLDSKIDESNVEMLSLLQLLVLFGSFNEHI